MVETIVWKKPLWIEERTEISLSKTLCPELILARKFFIEHVNYYLLRAILVIVEVLDQVGYQLHDVAF